MRKKIKISTFFLTLFGNANNSLFSLLVNCVTPKWLVVSLLVSGIITGKAHCIGLVVIVIVIAMPYCNQYEASQLVRSIILGKWYRSLIMLLD